MQDVEIYTDGSCLGNPGPGGWAALLRYGEHEQELMGYEHDTTNNRMELTAAIKALESLKQPSMVNLTTDSDYLRKGITEWIKKWKVNGFKTANRKPVKNIDLWQTLDELTSKHEIDWHWVKAHNGHPDNERVDQLARDAMENRNS